MIRVRVRVRVMLRVGASIRVMTRLNVIVTVRGSCMVGARVTSVRPTRSPQHAT